MKTREFIAALKVEIAAERLALDLWAFIDMGGEADMRQFRMFPLVSATPAIGITDVAYERQGRHASDPGQQPTSVAEFIAAMRECDPDATLHVVDEDGAVQSEFYFFTDWCGMITDSLSALYVSALSPNAEDGSWRGPSSREHSYPELGSGTWANPAFVDISKIYQDK